MSKSLYRHELKFFCTENMLERIYRDLKSVIRLDEHTGTDGKYLIRSIYYDDYNDSAYYENESGIDPRYKFRIRAYDCNTNRITVEKKYKYQGLTRKDSSIIDYNRFLRIINKERIIEMKGEKGCLDSFIYDYYTRLLHPVVIVQYNRIPFVDSIGNVRITFDTQISASTSFGNFFDNKLETLAILPSPFHILEVKYDDLLPIYIQKILHNYNLNQTTFSKYYLSRKALCGDFINMQEVI